MGRYRFAPSPTGDLHIGNFATALIAWLQARWNGGTFVLRIEDNDTQRSKPEYVQHILDDMRWLELDWDEGPEQEGDYGPYVQSRRTDHYEAALARLHDLGLTYPCYCSRKDLQALASAPHSLSAEGPAYQGICRHLSDAERRARESDKAPSIRFIQPNHPFEFVDGIRGPQRFEPAYGGDFVVRRADGIWAYQLACTVDDMEMGITHVTRGADLLDSTPRQLALLEALGGTPPEYSHTPLWMGPDGQRLSKRHGAVSVRAYRESGIGSEALLGWMAYYSGIRATPDACTVGELISSGPQICRRGDIYLSDDDLNRLRVS